MTEQEPSGICPKCRRPLDDHQLYWNGVWLSVPMCVEPGVIARGERIKP